MAPDLATKMAFDGTDYFVIVDGVRIAKRADPLDGVWIPLEPGWTVTGHSDDPAKLTITFDDPTAH